MNRRAIRVLNLRGLRERPGRTALMVLAVGSAVALAVGVLISQHSLDRSMREFYEALSGPAALRVEGPVDHGGLDASVLPRVAEVDGVQHAIPLVLAVAQAADGDGDTVLIPAVGVDCTIEAIAGGFGCTPELLAALRGGPALGSALRDRLGADGEVRTDLGVLPIADAPVVDALDDLNGGMVALFDLAAAQREFARPGGLDQILVVPEAGVDPVALRDRLDSAVGANNKVVDGASASAGAAFVVQLVLPLMFLVSLVALVIGGQLVRNTMELALEERRRELATAGALGRPPRDVLAGILAEAAVVGVVGGLLGLVLGGLVAVAFVAALSDQLARATGLRVDIALSPFALGAGVVVGVGLCLLASLNAARRASRRELAAELSERAQHEPERRTRPAWIVALMALAAATLAMAWLARRDGSLETWQPPVLVGGMLVAFVLAFQLNWMLVATVLRLLRGFPGFATGSRRVALDGLLSMPRRSAGIAAAIAAPAIMAVVLSSIVPGLGKGAERMAREGSEGRVYVSTLPTNNSSQIDAKITPRIERELAELPHVARIDRWYFAAIDHPTFGLTELDGVEGRVPSYRVHRGADGPTALAAGQAMVGPRLARDLDLDAGDALRVPGRYGMVELEVGGIWSAPAGVGRSIAVTAEVMRTITGPRPPDRLQVTPEAGTTAAELAVEIRGAGIDPRLIALDPEALAADYRDEFTSIASPFWAMQRALLVVAIVATASTLLLVAMQRRRETALLSALGMGPRALVRSTVVETMVLAGTATALAAVSGQLPLVCFTWASEVTTGLAIPYRPAASGLTVAALSATVVALLGAAVPAWRAGRADPITALREA